MSILSINCLTGVANAYPVVCRAEAPHVLMHHQKPADLVRLAQVGGQGRGGILGICASDFADTGLSRFSQALEAYPYIKEHLFPQPEEICKTAPSLLAAQPALV